MRLTQLRSFYGVVRAGGFTGAAKLLHVSQPTVTTQVRLLEDRYGVMLFHRRGRSVQPTELGRQLYEISKQIFSLESDALHLLQDSGALKSGHLRVGAVGPYHVTEMLAEFNRRYPGIQVSVRIGNSEEVLRGLRDYQTDVAVLARFTEDPQLEAVPYSRHPVAVFVHANHRFARRKTIGIEELEGEPIIMREVGSTTRKALEDALRRAQVRPRIAMEIGSREAIREAVAKGLGIGVVSEVEFVGDPRLRLVPISNAEIYTYAHVLCLRERRTARVVKAFFDIVQGLREERSGPANAGLNAPTAAAATPDKRRARARRAS